MSGPFSGNERAGLGTGIYSSCGACLTRESKELALVLKPFSLHKAFLGVRDDTNPEAYCPWSSKAGHAVFTKNERHRF